MIEDPLPQDENNSDLSPGDRSMRPVSGKHPLSYEALRDIIDLTLWTGQMLLQYGANSERVESAVHRIGTGLGCDWIDVDVSLDALTTTANSGQDFRTKTRRIIRRGVNYQIVAALNDLGRHVAEGNSDRHLARAELEQIASQPPGYPFWLTMWAAAFACAAFSRLFAGDWITFLTTFLATAAAMLLHRQLSVRYFNPYLIVVASAFTASLVASIADLFLLPVTTGTAMVASVLFLVPGVPLINAAQDVMRGYTDNGITRGVDGIVISLSIAIGVYFTLTITGLRLPYLLSAGDPLTLTSLIEAMFWAAIAALGFAIIFQVPRRFLFYTAFLGAVGVGAKVILLDNNLNLVASSLAGATLVGFGGYWLSTRYMTPSALFSVPGVIPLVPGGIAFQSLLTLIRAVEAGPESAEALFVLFAFEAITTGLVILVLGFGISFPFLLLRRQKPVI